MKRLFICYIVIFLITTVYADNLSVFQKYSQEAEMAFKQGNTSLCLEIEENIISLFNSNRKKNVKNNEICTIVFNSYCALAFLDERKSEKEICNLLSTALALGEENSLWIRDYTDKNHIIQCYVCLIGNYSILGDIESACIYNQKMINFAENHYRFEIADVLLTACKMYSRMHLFNLSHPLYQRLYMMFDELDKRQQYKVVKELIHFEFIKENYAELVKLAIIHENLIAKSKDEIKETVLDLISLGFKRNANKAAKECEGYYSIDVDNAFKTGCEWTLRNNQHIFPMLCIDYAYWLYGFNEYEVKALEQFRLYLKSIENVNQEEIFDNTYIFVEDAEQALISIIIQEIIKSPTPSDLNKILSDFPRVISAINKYPNSDYYEDFIKAIELSKEICYGTK